ncbi:hypothetical protein FSP39_019750 [Pinctada imbricata]|uniref:Uncharacterized protein n=1 Tax=Pinctada imbricata TaxID=66713 RepID=A0AA88XTK8_PINIB|nr:hypothetical protein FSP39_019750 [Pinctada imbricata]
MADQKNMFRPPVPPVSGTVRPPGVPNQPGMPLYSPNKMEPPGMGTPAPNINPMGGPPPPSGMPQRPNFSLNGHGTPPSGMNMPPYPGQPPYGNVPSKGQNPIQNSAFMNGPSSQPPMPYGGNSQMPPGQMNSSNPPMGGPPKNDVKSFPFPSSTQNQGQGPGMRMQGPPGVVPGVGPPVKGMGPPTATNLGPPPMNRGAPPQAGVQSTGQSSLGVPGQTSDSGGLPAPFHGQGQYSHQIGMALTPGITPNNSEPSSRKSTPDPSTEENQSFDALEGGDFSQTQNKASVAPPFPGNVTSFPSPGMPPQSRPQYGGMSGPQISRPPMSTAPGPGPQNQYPGAQNSFPGAQNRYPAPPRGFMGPPTSSSFGPPPTSTARFPPTGVPYSSAPPTSFGNRPAMPGPPTQYGSAPPTSTIQPPPMGPPGTMGMSQMYGQTPGQPPIPGPPSGPSPPQTQDMSAGRMGGGSGPANPQWASSQGYPHVSASAPSTGPGSFPMSQPNTGQMGSNVGGLNSSFGSMSLQDRVVNLLQDKHLIPPEGLETPKPRLHNEYKKVNCNPEVFRCTLTAIPQTSSLLSKARLPLGILIHPFKDLSQLPVIQSSVIVRCRSCRTYINPFVFFVDSRRWKCNLCYRVNELPEEFSYDPVSKTYGEPQRRPEIKSSTIEFIAPSDYMLRPPQPAVYLYLLDVSFNAIETGYLRVFCDTMLEELEKIPGDSRTQIGFIAYDRALHFFNLAEGLSQPQMLIVSDIEDIFLPCPDDLLVNLQESKELIIDLLNQLPTMFEGNLETGSALGAALQAAYKLASPQGGRVTVMQTVLPTVGPGALQLREDASQRATKNVSNLGPATDFYKKLALECSAQQVAVDVFMLNGQYADIASVSCISKYSGGSVQYYPSFHAVKNPGLSDKYEADLRRYLTRKIGFEAVMRIRCTKGLSIHTFHGNFFVRSTDLLSLPNINPDAGFGMQMSIEDSLVDTNTVCFQAALLYTSSKGERRIRVHTLCLPVTNQISEIYAGADQQAIASLLAKMGVDRSISSSMSDAREAIINAAVDAVAAYSSTIPSSQRMGLLPLTYPLRMLPNFCLALIKYKAFCTGVNTTLDDRVFAMQECKSLPIQYFIMSIYPHLYPVNNIESFNTEDKGDVKVPKPPVMHLSSANVDSHGAYIMDTYDNIYMFVGKAVSEKFCKDVLDQPNFMSIPENMLDLPELENSTSEAMRNFICHLMDSRPGGANFRVIREDSKFRVTFFQHMVEDRTEASMSYYEFLQHIQKQVKS